MSKTLIKQIPLISNCKEVIEIKKGFSTDEKYLIHMQDGNKKLLLRMFNLEELEIRKTEYSIMERCAGLSRYLFHNRFQLVR